MYSKFYLETAPEGVRFLAGKRLIGIAEACEGAEDRFIPLRDGVYRWIRTCAAPRTDMTLRFRANWEPEFTMIPACQYQGNREPSIMDYEKIRRITNGESEEGAEYPSARSPASR